MHAQSIIMAKKFFICAALLFAATSLETSSSYAQTSGLIINEIMQSNIDGVFIDHDFPDSWVELYNPTDQAVDLKGWALSDDRTLASATVFPALTVPAGGYAMVYCDKESKPFHTSFRVESGKGTLTLFNPQGEVADDLSFKKMLAPNIAYGRIGDGAGKWGYLLTATPGQANCTASGSDILPAPVFSHTGGICTAPFRLEISIPEGLAYENLTLCVTTDGREPSPADAVEGNLYSAQVDASVAVRAKIFASNAHSPLSTTQTYIFHPRETTLPIAALTLPKDYLLDENEGIYVEGTDPEHPNFHQKHRKPYNLEFYINGRQQINQVGELRVSGFSSAYAPQKSLALYANKRFGTKRYDVTDVWPEKPEMKEVKSFHLRNGGGTLFNCGEPALHLLIARSGLENVYYQAYRPTITYINGHLVGIYNIRERSNEDWFEANFPDVEKFDMVENWYEPKEGSIDDLIKARDVFYDDQNCTFDNFQKYFNVENFINTFAYEIIIGNFDYFYNNIVHWRIGDGTWNLLLKDLDMGVWSAIDCDLFDTMKSLQEDYEEIFNQHQGPKFFEKVCRIPEIKEMLYRKMAFILGDFMQLDNITKTIDEVSSETIAEMPDHITTFYPQYNLDLYLQNIVWFKERFEARLPLLWGQMKKNLNAPESFELTVETENLPFTFNGDRMSMPSFNGRWFLDAPLTLATTDPDNDSFAEVAETDLNDKVTAYSIDKITDKSFTNVKSVKITLKAKDSDGISDIVADSDQNNAPVEYFDLAGRRVSSEAKGILIRRQGSTVTKIIR